MAPLRSSAIVATALSLLACFQSSIAGPVVRRSDLAVKDYHPAPRAWANLGRAPEDHLIHLTIGLTQSRFAELERHLYEVSDPSHSRYGQHLSAEEVHELVKPSKDASAAVHAWLEDYGVELDQLKYSPAKDFVSVTLPVEAVEDLLDTEYSVYEHDDGSTMVRTEGYSLPLHLHEHISTVQPTNSWARLNGRRERTNEIVKRSLTAEKRSSHALEVENWGPPPAPLPLPSNATVEAACNFSAVTPDCLRTLYGTLDYEVKAAGINKIAHTSYLGESSNRSDISIFLSKYRPEATAYAWEFTEVSVAGGNVYNGTSDAADGNDREANLDSEYIIGISYPTPLTTYNVGGENPTFMPDINTPTNSDEPYLAWTMYMAGLPDDEVPQVISTSYGDDEQTVSRSYAQAVCNQFAQLGARGVTLFFSSGDFGVGADSTCYSNVDNTTYMFIPSFPTDCPYVTTVGATRNYPEVAADRLLSSGLTFASGAGFSNYFDMPAYQASTVDAYVASLDGLYDGFYNKSGRAYPDISCIGQTFPTIWNGSTLSLVGTSGSSPICASVFTLLNDALIAEGKPPMGFINPWLYSIGHTLFTDVTNGSSKGCNTTGFPAAPGWDAVSGWGTPYLPDLLEFFGVKK
ncbi:peptidase S8/S53 domain-containing protein [Exophiala viscosa]|uniref:tripeptidyl-peptidase II n=1 Tax=Exophiala viscosa TaxID=2486360 RepID=A0AAN6DTN5_9EURO|nr:peptidase S8/S53 domain-containing protein [Exophiala viscosa]